MATLEVYDEFDRRGMPVTLDGDLVTIGRRKDNVLVIEDDDTVSNSHLVLKSVGQGWDVRDLGTTNGTMLNGERLTHEVVLRHGDELLIGHTRLKYLNPQEGHDKTTKTIDTPPHVTPREHEVLVQLCLPRLDGSPFTPPAPVATIAKKLYVGRAAVANHIASLYRKFGVPDGDNRLAELANQAMYRRAVTMEQLREAKQRDEPGD